MKVVNVNFPKRSTKYPIVFSLLALIGLFLTILFVDGFLHIAFFWILWACYIDILSSEMYYKGFLDCFIQIREQIHNKCSHGNNIDNCKMCAHNKINRKSYHAKMQKMSESKNV